MLWFAVLFIPICPMLLYPHAQSVESCLIANENVCPALIFSQVGALENVCLKSLNLLEVALVKPSPSWPYVLVPLANRLLEFFDNATAYLAPPDTSCQTKELTICTGELLSPVLLIGPSEQLL